MLNQNISNVCLPWITSDWFCRVIFSCLGLVIIVATLYDGWRLHYEKRPIQSQSERFSVRMLHCFSALSNAKAVLNTSTNNPDNLACLNGIRVVTTTWVMMGHIWRWHISRSNLLYNRNQLYEVISIDEELYTVELVYVHSIECVYRICIRNGRCRPSLPFRSVSTPFSSWAAYWLPTLYSEN